MKFVNSSVRWLLLLLLVPALIAPALAIADRGFQISPEDTFVIVDAPKQEIFKFGEPIMFNVHAYNAITGVPLGEMVNATYNISCVAHFYNSTGDKIAEDILTYDGDFDFYDYIIDANITNVSGRHDYRVWCGLWDTGGQGIDLIAGGWVSSYFDITPTGSSPPEQNLIIFSFIAFIAIIGFLLYFIFETFGKLIVFDIELKDVSFNLIAYLTLIAFNYFNSQYIGNILIQSTTDMFISIGAITNILLPVIAFIVCFLYHKTQARKVENDN